MSIDIVNIVLHTIPSQVLGLISQTTAFSLCNISNPDFKLTGDNDLWTGKGVNVYNTFQDICHVTAVLLHISKCVIGFMDACF